MTDTTAAPSPADADTKTFADFGVRSEIIDALAAHDITSPFPIQELTLPLALAGADLIGQARTGTGKTLAFGIPLLQRLDDSKQGVQALVIVPTRELCVQVHGDLTQAGAHLDIEVVAVYGGKAMEPQIAAIKRGANVVVGTPGRLLDLVNRGVLDLSGATSLVLDEADEMLDLGFLPDVEALIERTAAKRQTLLFSATMPSAVVALARRYMDKPTFLRADVEEVRIAPETTQHFFSCHRMDKPAVVARILQAPERGLCVVFTRTKRMADILAEELRERGVAAAPIHSDLRQEARERALSRFRDGKVTVLVATEVAARGLDISDVTHVINYDCPDDEKMYLHRIGRTGRAGAAGVAVTLAVWNELARLEMIKKALGIDEPTHEVFSTSPVLDELLGLPERARRPARTVTADDVKAARSSSGRGRGSGRSSSRRSAEAPAAGDRGAERSEAPAGAEGDTTAAEPAEATDESAGQARSRSRRRRGGRTRGPSTSTGREGDTDSTPADADADADAPSPEAEVQRSSDADVPTDADASDETRAEDGDGTRRTRTRTRTRRATPSASDAPAKPAADAAQETSDADSEADEAKPSGSRSATESRRRSRRATNARGGRGRSSSAGTRGGGERGGGGSKAGGGSQRARSSSGSGANGRDRQASGRGSGGNGGRAGAPKVDAQTARADGKPALKRPLRIAHLP